MENLSPEKKQPLICIQYPPLYSSAPGVVAPYLMVPTGWGTTNLAKWLLWEDPLLSHLSPQVSDKDMIKHYRQLASALDRRIGAAMRGGGGGGNGRKKEKVAVEGGGSGASAAEESRWAHPLAFPAALAKVLARKLAFRRDLQDAYGSKNRLAMARLIGYNLGPTTRRAGFGHGKFLQWGQKADGGHFEAAETESSDGISNTTMEALREMRASASDDTTRDKAKMNADGGGGGELGGACTS
jgi:hypothetical protein